MYDPEILDFEDQMKEAGKKTIIIGNGFGLSFDRAFGKKCFSWNSLLDLCEIEEGTPLYDLMAECGYDFELAHQKLNNALEVLKKYSEPQDRIDYYQAQVETLREQLVVAVSASHPDSFSFATRKEEGKIGNFFESSTKYTR